MKSIVISSNSSGGGKNHHFCWNYESFNEKKGFDVQGYKVGPDYIDPAFHSKITGKPSRNLDIYLMEEEGIKASILGEGRIRCCRRELWVYMMARNRF